MKRSELKAGGEYYYDRHQDWAEAKYGTGSKAVVVDDQRYAVRESTWGHRSSERWYPNPKGTAVLVDLYWLDHNGKEKVERTAVPVAHLRGPWEQTQAAVDARVKALREREQAAVGRRQDGRKRAAGLVALAASLGLEIRFDVDYRTSDVTVAMSLDTATRLLDAYEKNAAKETGTHAQP